MARRIKSRPTKKAIYVFWEGESEEAYTKYLKNGDADKKLDSKRKEFIRDVHKRAGSVCFGRV